jgi:hypothetical protein
MSSSIESFDLVQENICSSFAIFWPPSRRHRIIFVHHLGLLHNAVQDELELLGLDAAMTQDQSHFGAIAYILSQNWIVAEILRQLETAPTSARSRPPSAENQSA